MIKVCYFILIFWEENQFQNDLIAFWYTLKSKGETNKKNLMPLTYLINKRHGSLTLEQTIWLWNHTSHSKFYFNEFVANAFRDNIGMTSEVVEVSLFALWQEQKCWHRNLLCIWFLVTGWCNEWNIVPCPSMWQKQFWLVQNGFGLTKLIWTSP